MVEEVISEQDKACEDYPCEQTMHHWKYWMHRNENHIDGQMKSTADRLLDPGTEFTRSVDSLLKELKERLSPGWLKAVNQFLYNTGGGDSESGLELMHLLLFVVTKKLR